MTTINAQLVWDPTGEVDAPHFQHERLPECFAIRADGSMHDCRPGRMSVARAIIPGCDDPRMIDKVRTPSGRVVWHNWYAERDEHLNYPATALCGVPIYGTAVFSPIK